MYFNRKRTRKSGYDYAQEAYYFVTICTKNKEKLFSSIVGNGLDRSLVTTYTKYGEIALKHLQSIESHFTGITLNKYVVMPNHIHMIITIGCDNSEERSRPFPTLSTVVGLYKSGVSKEIGFSVWQKSFHDHIIRNKNDYENIWNYIDQNPLKWQTDCYFSD